MLTLIWKWIVRRSRINRNFVLKSRTQATLNARSLRKTDDVRLYRSRPREEEDSDCRGVRSNFPALVPKGIRRNAAVCWDRWISTEHRGRRGDDEATRDCVPSMANADQSRWKEGTTRVRPTCASRTTFRVLCRFRWRHDFLVYKFSTSSKFFFRFSGLASLSLGNWVWIRELVTGSRTREFGKSVKKRYSSFASFGLGSSNPKVDSD